jgi:Trehalose utilisation
MPSKILERMLLGLLTLGMVLVYAQAHAQPPSESTTKVKRVLLYEKVQGWESAEAIAEIGRTFEHLAKVKGFQVDTLKSDSGLTPENLKRYQVIVWNNNGSGAASVPSPSARSAVMDYLRQGGGWMAMHLAADHIDSWPEFGELMGTKFAGWSSAGTADLVADSAAKRHPELRHVLASLPDSIRLIDGWLGFSKTVRPLPGVTVLYTARNGQRNSNGENPLVPPSDGSKDPVYVWAREEEKGRFLYNGLVHGPEYQGLSVTAQADSAVTRLIWTSLRWLAGDFRNGCTNPASPRFDPDARIDDGSCLILGLNPGLKPELGSALFGIRLAGRRLLLDGLFPEAIRITLRDLRGALVWQRSLPTGTRDIHLEASLEPGVYLLEAHMPGRSFSRRAAIPVFI